MKWKKSITDFQFFLKIERGLSQNTIDSYSRDLKKLSLFLEENNINFSPISINETNLAFIKMLFINYYYF